MQFGVHAEALPLARARVVDRNAIIALESQGFHTPQALADVSPQVLAQWVPTGVAHDLKSWGLRNLGGSPPATGGEVRPPTSPPVLIVDDRLPGEILIEGKTVRLQEKQYWPVRTLAECPGECIGYERVYAAIGATPWSEPDALQKRRRAHQGGRATAQMVRTSAGLFSIWRPTTFRYCDCAGAAA